MTLYLACFALMGRAVKKYESSFLLFLAVFCFMTRNVRIISIPLSTLTLFWFFLLFVSKYRKFINNAKTFPWKIPFIALAVSIVLSSVFSISGFGSEVSTMSGNILKGIILILILWCVVDNKNNFWKLYYYISIVIFISCIYGILEYFLQSNPLQQYLAGFSGNVEPTIWTYDDAYRGYRICSIFEHAMGAAVNWSMYFVFTLFLFIKKSDEFRKRKYFCMLTAVLSLICVFLTKCRSPIIFLALFSLIIVLPKRKRFYYILFLAIPIILFLGNYVLSNSLALLSIVQLLFEHENGQLGGSSSISLRSLQIATAFELMKISSIVGLGTHFKDVLPSSMTFYILGGESLLISVPSSYGILGLIAYSIMMLFDITIIPIKYKSKECCILGIAYWTVNILTSVPGIMNFIYYFIMIYFIKDKEWVLRGGGGAAQSPEIEPADPLYGVTAPKEGASA